MKRVLNVLCLLAMLLVASVSHGASPYEEYYNGDYNYPLIWGHQGMAWYLDKSSLVCQDYDPPCYTLAINVFLVPEAGGGSREISREQTMRFFYNLSDLKMYVGRGTGASDDWRYLEPTGSNAASGRSMYVGEAAFYINYGKKFYGSRTWYNSMLQENMSVFSDSFYEKL